MAVINAGALPLRMRLAPYRTIASRHRCRRFSTPQCSHTTMATVLDPGGDGVRKIATVHRLGVAHRATARDQSDAAQPRPQRVIGQGAHEHGEPVATHLQAPAVLVDLLMVIVRDRCEVSR